MLTDRASADKHTLILRATLELLATCGFHGFSMKQLAERAGVAAGTLYLYFKDREDLIRQLHQEIIQTFVHHVLSGLDSNAPLAEQYRHICLGFWRFCLDNPNILMGKGQFEHLPADLLRDHHQDAWQALQPLADLLDACRAAGLVKPLSNEILATLGLDLFPGLARKVHLGLVNVDELELDEIVRASWDAIACHSNHLK